MILPCGNTVCQSCIQKNLVDSKISDLNEFKCFMCEEIHKFPQNKPFPVNRPLAKLLNKELKRFNLTGESADKLNLFLDRIQKEKCEIDNLSKEYGNKYVSFFISLYYI